MSKQAQIAELKTVIAQKETKQFILGNRTLTLISHETTAFELNGHKYFRHEITLQDLFGRKYYEFTTTKRDSAEQLLKPHGLELIPAAEAAKVLTSAHVSNVEAHFEYSAGNIRYYTAISRVGSQQHIYRVAVKTENGVRKFKCNCAGGAKDLQCRHAVRVAETDSRLTGIPLNITEIARYKAWKKYEKDCDARKETQIEYDFAA